MSVSQMMNSQDSCLLCSPAGVNWKGPLTQLTSAGFFISIHGMFDLGKTPNRRIEEMCNSTSPGRQEL